MVETIDSIGGPRGSAGLEDVGEVMGQLGDRQVKLGQAQPRATAARSTTWMQIKHWFTSLFGIRVSTARPEAIQNVGDAVKTLISDFSRKNVNEGALLGGLEEVRRRGNFPLDERREGLTNASGELFRGELANLTDMQLWRLHQNISAKGDLLAIGQAGIGELMGRAGDESEDERLAMMTTAGKFNDVGFLALSLAGQVRSELGQRGFKVPAAQTQDVLEDSTLSVLVRMGFDNGGDIVKAVADLQAQRVQVVMDGLREVGWV